MSTLEPTLWKPTIAFRSATIAFAALLFGLACWLGANEWAGDRQLREFVGIGLFFLTPPIVSLRFAFRSRIELASDALIVVTTFSQHRFSWSDIHTAEPGYAGITLRFHDDSAFVAGAVQKSNLAVSSGRRTKADELADLIRARATAARSAPINSY